MIGPPGLRDLFEALRRITGRVRYELELVELAEDEPVRHDDYEIRPFAVDHRVRAYGYALVEDERPGRFDPETAERLGVAAGPGFARLQAGETVDGADGPVEPAQVMGEARAGRKIVLTGDTAPSEMTRIAAHDAELLIHDASFADEELARAGETAHSTARQAARIAARGAGQGAGPGPHLLALSRGRRARGGARGVPRRVRAPRLRRRRDPVPRARRATADRERRARAGAAED